MVRRVFQSEAEPGGSARARGPAHLCLAAGGALASLPAGQQGGTDEAAADQGEGAGFGNLEGANGSGRVPVNGLVWNSMVPS